MEKNVLTAAQQDHALLPPPQQKLVDGLIHAKNLLDDIVGKQYLHQLAQMDVFPVAKELAGIENLRLFRITEMVYQEKEISAYKFAAVYGAVQHIDASIALIIQGNRGKTEFYIGVRRHDPKKDAASSICETLENALKGKFPGVKTEGLMDERTACLLEDLPKENIAAVSCVANGKDAELREDAHFVQGLERFARAMQGRSYTAIILARNAMPAQIEELRRSYQEIYTQLSPFANIQLSYGTNDAVNISHAFTEGVSEGATYSVSEGYSKGWSYGKNSSVTESDTLQTAVKMAGALALGVAAAVAAPETGGASLAATGPYIAGQFALGAFTPKTHTKGENWGVNEGINQNTTYTLNQTINKGMTYTQGASEGSSQTTQLTMQNKSILDVLARIDLQLKRIEECESLGMWECAAYFLADRRVTVEMAAGTYKALMRGEHTGVETAALNIWDVKSEQRAEVFSYLQNLLHPTFSYPMVVDGQQIPARVTPASLISSNELAIHMGLPRQSLCGFPVTEHAAFAQEVVGAGIPGERITLGTVYHMGEATWEKACLARDSLAMHTFITGATGAGKSNAVYHVLDRLQSERIPFLVVEPAKGEYKNVFGSNGIAAIYGTNPKRDVLLRLNPFRFPKEVHVLEHLDRLVEIFNVCWPMYAAMPAILKEAIEEAYVQAGWDLCCSENAEEKYPTFLDVEREIKELLERSEYSSDSKGDYKGALLTRIHSLSTGLNGVIFVPDDLTDAELFDKNVIVDLSRVGSMETKALIMGLLVMKLNEYRMADEGAGNRVLRHVTVLEEAHHLLRRTSTEQSSESSNLLGKSVELLSNAIAEMRTYGEGFIIADQSPGMLDLSAIRNTNTKIILRLPEQSDRELVGYAAGLKEEQIGELAKLPRGVAAVYQNDWIAPVLVQIEKCRLEERPYQCSDRTPIKTRDDVRLELLRFLIQGRVQEKLDYSLAEIERGLPRLGLHRETADAVRGYLEEAKRGQKILLWEGKKEKYAELSIIVTAVLSLREALDRAIRVLPVEKYSEWMESVLARQFPDTSSEERFVLSYCMMRDMKEQLGESEMRDSAFGNWCKFSEGKAVR